MLGAIGSLTHGNVRLALHPGVTARDIDRFIAAVTSAIEDLRNEAGAPNLG